MPTTSVNGVRLLYELNGTDEIPLVLVHGAWSSHHTWDRVAPRLAESFRVLTYDRRGHSGSERPVGQGSVREDVADLAALIEHLGLAPAWVAESSFGATITLRLASERPDILLGIICHEPAPLFSLLADDPAFASMLYEVSRKEQAVVERVASGDHAGAAEQFVETVALGPGSWTQLPPQLRQTLIENAPSFLDEVNDPERNEFDLDELKGFSQPALLTLGDQSPPFYAPIVAMFGKVLNRAKTVTFPGAGHVPYNTHPEAYIEVVTAFIREHTE
jgi:pimeloyl-ACP methyl ester carboxylesterase